MSDKQAYIGDTLTAFKDKSGQYTIQERKGFIAFVDALGTKGIWTRKDPKTVIQDWVDLVTHFEEEARGSHVQAWAFSDTIIATLESDDLDSSKAPIPVIVELLAKLFTDALESGFLLRGAISRGLFYRERPMIIGPAVDDAAEWYEAAEWMGIMLTPQTSFFVDKLLLTNQVSEIRKLVR